MQWLDFCFVTEPNAPPSNVTGYNASSTSIFVQWDQVPAQYQNGRILRYTVIYRTLPVCRGSVRGSVTTSDNNITLTGLNKYTDYNITVFASTVKGNGNVSAAIIIRTDQDGKCTLLGYFRYMVSSLAVHLLLCVFFFTCSSSGKIDNIQLSRVPIYCNGVLAQEGLTPKSCKLYPTSSIQV